MTLCTIVHGNSRLMWVCFDAHEWTMMARLLEHKLGFMRSHIVENRHFGRTSMIFVKYIGQILISSACPRSNTIFHFLYV